MSCRLLTELSLVGIGQAGSLFGSVLATKVLTSGLGGEQYGQFALATTIPLLLQQFVFGPSSQAGLRFYPEFAARDDIAGLLGILLPWINRLTRWAFALAVVAALVLMATGLVLWGPLLVLAMVIGLAQNYQGLFGSLQAAARRRVPVAIHQALEPCARAAGAFLLMRMLGAQTIIAAAGVALGSGAVATSQYFSFRLGVPGWYRSGQPDTALVGPAVWAYGANFAVWGVATWAQLASDRWALKAFAGDEVVGLYAVAFQLASVPTLLAGAALSQFVFPIVFHGAGDGRDPTALRHAAHVVHVVTAGFGLVVVGTAFGALVGGTPIIVMFTSKAFGPAGPLVAPLVIALGLMQAGHLLGLIALSAKDLTLYRWVKLSQGIGAVMLNAAGAWLGGAQGVVLANVVSAAGYCAAVIWVNHRILASRRHVTATHV